MTAEFPIVGRYNEFIKNLNPYKQDELRKKILAVYAKLEQKPPELNSLELKIESLPVPLGASALEKAIGLNMEKPQNLSLAAALIAWSSAYGVIK